MKIRNRYFCFPRATYGQLIKSKQFNPCYFFIQNEYYKHKQCLVISKCSLFEGMTVENKKGMFSFIINHNDTTFNLTFIL